MLLGEFRVDPPVVLAPMAGITNIAFRRLCREQGHPSERSRSRPLAQASTDVGSHPSERSRSRPLAQASTDVGSHPSERSPGRPLAQASTEVRGRGLYICEMITTRALVEGNPKTRRMIAFGATESPRSLQLYGVDPATVRKAVEIIVDENLADHIDLNFGCSVPKVTRRGGGSALPYKRRLFAELVGSAVRAAGPLPVTVKMRKGIDEDHLTYVEAGRAAAGEGVAWVALHARTAAQRYSGTADWAAISSLVDALGIPVLGNGDIWEADDALRMVAETGCAGVVVGRGCLGRPWLFADLAAAFAGSPARVMPSLAQVAAVMRRHAELLCTALRGEREGVTDFRKHVAWYLKGFAVGAQLRRALATASSLSELDSLLGQLDGWQPFPTEILGSPRGRTNAPARVHLPDGWLADRDEYVVPEGAELDDSGG